MKNTNDVKTLKILKILKILNLFLIISGLSMIFISKNDIFTVYGILALLSTLIILRFHNEIKSNLISEKNKVEQ